MNRRRFVLAVAGMAVLSVSFLHATDVSIVGPEQFNRSIGRPNVFVRTFTGFPDNGAEGTITVLNGDPDGSNRVSSATITLNGNVVFTTDDFNQRVYRLEGAFDVLTSNELVVELASKPGSFVTVEVSQEIGADAGAVFGIAGGEVKFDDPSGAMFGFEVYVPDGAVLEDTLFTLSHMNTPVAPLPGAFEPIGMAVSIESTTPLASMIFLNIPWGQEPVEDDIRVLFVHDPDSDTWELVPAAPGPDPGKILAQLSHLSVYQKGRVRVGFASINSGFSMEADAHTINNRIGCRCDNGDVHNNGMCAGMALLAEEFFTDLAGNLSEGLRCHWIDATDFDASCDAHCRHSRDTNDWFTNLLSALGMVSRLSGAHQGFVIDYVKAMLLFNSPVSLGLIGEYGGADSGHAVLAIGWEKTGIFDGQLVLYDVNDNQKPGYLTYSGADILTFLSYSGTDSFGTSWSYDTAVIITRHGLSLGDVFADYEKDHTCVTVDECSGQCCSTFTPGCNSEHPNKCYCFTTTEGIGICANDFYCADYPSCSSSSDCATDQACYTCTCCGVNKCGPTVCDGSFGTLKSNRLEFEGIGAAAGTEQSFSRVFSEGDNGDGPVSR